MMIINDDEQFLVEIVKGVGNCSGKNSVQLGDYSGMIVLLRGLF